MSAKSLLVSLTYISFCLLQSQLTIVQAQRSNIETLRFVHAIWRHGDRTPSQETFPSDTGNRAETWPEGLGQLTMLGVRQQYELGRYLRQRYDGFLSRKYSPYEMTVRSTSYDRTIMSASANMAGLFEPEGDQIWNKDLRWQPVSIQVVPKEDDPLLYTYRTCPVADQLFDDFIQNSPELRRLEQQYGRLLKFLEEKAGLNRTLRLYDDVYEIYDPLLCQLLHNDTHTWPSWMNMTIFLELEELYDMILVNIYPTFDLQRLRGGLLLGDILSRMKNRTTNNQTKQKFMGYSAHDTTMVAFLNNLGAPQPRGPPFAALLMIELHQRNNQSYVEMYYKNDTNRDAYSIEIGECPRPCTLSQFSVRSEPRIPKDWFEECGIDECGSNQVELTTSTSFIDILNAMIRKIAALIPSSS